MKKDFLLIALITAILLIGLAGVTSAASVTVAANNSHGKNTAQYICDGSSDQKEIIAAISKVTSSGGGDLILLDGTFNVGGDIILTSGVNLVGKGAGTTTLNFVSAGRVKVNGNNNLHDFQTMGQTGIIIVGSHVKLTNITVRNYTAASPAFYIYATSKVISDITFTSCNAIDGSSYGFRNGGDGSPNGVSDITYSGCSAINAGRAARSDNWISGFYLTTNTNITNMLVENCRAEGSWESGFYFGGTPQKNNVIIRNSTSINNGQKKTKTTPSDGAGFLGGSPTMQFIDCTSQGNIDGFRLLDGATVIRGKDIGSTRAFRTSNAGNILLTDCWSDQAQQWAFYGLVSHDVMATKFKVTNPKNNPFPAILVGTTQYPSYNMNIQIAGVPISTTVPTTVATPVPTTIPPTIGPVTNAVEAAAYANSAYTQGNVRLAQIQQAYRTWVVPSRPDLVKIATNVRSSGLKGDGVTDDTAALQSLLTKLPSGSTIYFPPGHYRIDGPISINKPFTLFGESGTVFDCQKATVYGIFTLNKGGSPTSMMKGMTITGIVFEGPGIETDPAMIDAYYLQNFNISHVKFHNIGYAAICVSSCTDVTVEGSIFDNVFQTGYGYGVCIMDHSDRITIHDNFFVTKGRHGVTTGTRNQYLLEADYVRNVTVENNYFENMTSQAVDSHEQTIGPYTVIGNVMNNCELGISFRAGEAEITDNVMIDCVRGVRLLNQNILLEDPKNLDPKVDRILDNTMINISSNAIQVNLTNVLIQGNVAKGLPVGVGVYLDPYVPNTCNIIGNVVEDFKYGFKAEIPGPTISLRNNFIRNNGGIYQGF